jgi:glutamate synthase domain-containing protein 1
MVRQPKNSSSEEFLKFQKTPTFFSNLQEAAKNIKDKNKKNVTGWMNVLTDVQKNNGIRNVNQEAEWIGLEDYLNEYTETNQPKNRNIPFEVVQQYIQDNQIEIVEVSKGELESVVKYEELPKKVQDLYNEWRQDGSVESFNYLLDELSPLEYGVEDLDNGDINIIKTNKNPSKYSEYQLEGSERYREVLFTLPNKKESISENILENILDVFNKENKGKDDLSNVLDALKHIEAIENVKDNQPKIYNAEGFNKFEKSLALYEKRLNQQDDYESSHWDELNILAHIRLNERTLPNGEKVLFIEEIQDDLGKDTKVMQDSFLKEVEKNSGNVIDQLIKEGIIEEEC